MDKKRILLVEDENVTAMDIESYLVRLGYEVPAIVSSGEEAIRAAAEARPDLVLMDITLDGPMSGIEAAAEIWKAHAIPIVFLTAHTDAETVGLARTAEPFGYLTKPCNLASLMSTIEVALYKGEADAQRRKAEDMLKQVMEEQKIILDNIVSGVFFLKQRAVKWANRKAAMMFGYSCEEIAGKETSLFYPDRESFEQLGREAYPLLAQGKTYSVERPMKKKGGELIWCSLTGQAVNADQLEEGAIWLLDDITERKQTEEELKGYRMHLEDLVVKRTAEVGESEKKYRNLFELAGDAIVVADSETGVIIDANLRAELMLNRDRSELIGMHQSALHPPEATARYRDLFKNALTDEPPPLRELGEDVAVINKEGKKIPVEISTSRLELGGRSVQVGVFKDLRQRKMQEEALMLLKKAVDSIPLGVTIVDRQGSIVYVNKAEADLHGYEQEALLGEQSRVYAPPGWTGGLPVEKLLESAELLKDNFTRESENIRKDGSVFPVEISSVPVRGNGGELIALISVCKDISERKQAMIALEERERKYRDLYQQFLAVLDVVPDVMMLLTPDLRLKWINKTSDPDLFRMPAMPGARCCDIFKLCGGPESCPVRRTLEAGESAEWQVSVDNERTLDVRTFPVFGEGGTGTIGHALCVISDVTEKLRLFGETARAKQLASIGELAAGVAHEINNPLNSVINYAQLLMDDNGVESETRRLSERIFKEGCRIESIVKGLLSFARHRPGEKTRCEFAPMIGEVLMLLRTQLGREGITVKLELPPGLPAVTANQQQMEQVLMNLVNNARYALNKKYAERNENKTIEIRGNAGQGEAGRMITISVLDRGCGIPADALSKVMNPFFTTKPPGSGTGLGLSICHGIVLEHGGKISIRSVENEFTEVLVELPVGRSEDGNNG